MSAAGSSTPLSYSDIPCDLCGLYFKFDGELIDHREVQHANRHRSVVHLIQGEFPIAVCESDNQDWPCEFIRASASSGPSGSDSVE